MNIPCAGHAGLRVGCRDKPISGPPPDAIRALLVDMDGVLFHGERPLPGAARFLERILGAKRLGKKTALVRTGQNRPLRSWGTVAPWVRAAGLGQPRPAGAVGALGSGAAVRERVEPRFLPA